MTALPLTELWNTEAELGSVHCVGRVGREELTELLRRGPVLFVVADVGLGLGWVDRKECFTFWKEEVKTHLADRDEIHRETFPGGYAYVAKQWITDLSDPVIVLEKHH